MKIGSLSTSYTTLDLVNLYYYYLCNGHSSHCNLNAITFAKENRIIMFTLIPHTTHAMQPLDTAVYGLLKTSWQDVCYNYIQSYPGQNISLVSFSVSLGYKQQSLLILLVALKVISK